MRNFKKFLALVLAMLMVSACAVSVSAFDDVAATDDYAAAVEMLADLGVISGRGDGKFYPEDTLTRQEAAKIAAMLIAGAKGQTMDWNKATCSFADVDAEWAYAYIDYVAQRNVMKGDGEGFKPERKLQIDEAIKIAVAVANSEWAKEAFEDTEDYAPDYWAVYWIDQANTHDLLKDCDIVYYDVPCTRGMFAQIVYNALKATNNKIAAGFGYKDVVAEVAISKVDNVKVVTLTNVNNADDKVAVTEELFNTYLKETNAKYLEQTNSRVRYTMFANNGVNKVVKLLSVEVLSDIDTVLYSAEQIKYVKENNTFKANLVKIGDYTYTLGVDDDEVPSSIIGAAVATVRGIHLYIDGTEKTTLEENKTFPKYYQAYLSDLDNDGDYERCDITTYEIAVAKADGTTATASKNIVNYKINGVDFNKAVDKEVVWDTDAVLDNTTPMLINAVRELDAVEDKYFIDVIEVAKSASGKLTSIDTANSAAVIDGTSIKVVNGITVDNNTLKQTISYYTLNNEIVKIVAFDNKVIVLDKATVNADGKVVLEGFDGTSFANVTYILDGKVEGGKFVAETGHYADETSENKNYAKDVYLGGKKNAAGLWGETGIKFVEGTYYTVTVTTDGTYYSSTGKTLAETFTTPVFTDDQGVVTTGTLTVDPSYVTLGKIPTFINKGVKVIIPVVAPVASEAAKNAYSTTYKIATTFDKTESVKAFSDTPTAKSEVSYIYVTEAGVVDTTVKAIEADQTIVQILGAYTAADYDYYTYNAFDLIAGKKVTVKSTSILTDKAYYLAEEGMIVDGDPTDDEALTPTAWVRADAKLTRDDNGIVLNYLAKYTQFKDNDADGFAETLAATSNKDFSKIMITIYATKADGTIDYNADGTAKVVDLATLLAADGDSLKLDAYVVEGKFIAINY